MVFKRDVTMCKYKPYIYIYISHFLPNHLKGNWQSSKNLSFQKMLSFCHLNFYDDSDGHHQITVIILL